MLADNSRQTVNSIQEINELVIAAVNKLAKSSNQMLEFIDNNVMKDYDTYATIVNQYLEDASHMHTVFSEFADSANDITGTMQEVDTGINDIAQNMEESAKAVSSVATDVNGLVTSITDIQKETSISRNISDDMETEVKRFKKL